MTLFVTVVLILAVAVVAGIAIALTGRVGWLNPTVEPADTLPPVLLPERPGPDDVDLIRLAPALRGYRMDQVDEVLDRLAGALRERDRRIAELTASITSADTVDRRGDAADSVRPIRDVCTDSEY